ncbi:MAG: hypothetical protein RMX97_24690 [Nostoc sp. DedQUE11]|nr:hypothetical protein [Nostoc sp. DedQUE11]MDZ8072815.1 hypothetical protein [Nostoc sp. DedQUE01]
MKFLLYNNLVEDTPITKVERSVTTPLDCTFYRDPKLCICITALDCVLDIIEWLVEAIATTYFTYQRLASSGIITNDIDY